MMAEEDDCPEVVIKFLELRKDFHTRESITLGLNYKPTKSDGFICGGAKTGTTVMQQASIKSFCKCDQKNVF